MVADSIWIVGASRSGKTTRLVEHFCRWLNGENDVIGSFYTKKTTRVKSAGTAKFTELRQTDPGVLLLAANDDNRRDLGNIIVTKTLGKYPVRAKTPLGFFQDEVTLFWPLLIESLQLKAQFPVRLRPETEQELATKLWRSHLDPETLSRAGINEYRLVRRILDLLQLAAYSGVSCTEIGSILEQGLDENTINLQPQFLASLLLDWRDWCLERGFLTYGIITELYGQHLLTNSNYQQHLAKRYQAVLADDVDDYPGVARHLFDFLLDQGAVGAFSYNPDGAIRLGLGADPHYIEGLAGRCRIETCMSSSTDSLVDSLGKQMVELVREPTVMLSLPETVRSIQTTSRAQLLRQTAEAIADTIKSGEVEPEEVAVIAPGLDAIARYTLIEILNKQSIQVEPLNDQRPLLSSPAIRALLTILTLVYPGLGRLVDRDAIAEMLVIFSSSEISEENVSSAPQIDPVRAGLIADYCFEPHPDRPNLLPVTTFERWDRIGYAATAAYNDILKWIEQQRQQQAQRLIPSPISLLYLAIQNFFCKDTNPPYEELAALRELLETAQHYWEINTRIRQISPSPTTPETTLTEFIQLLRRGTITANPYPLHRIGSARKAVTLATIFQYRSSRRFHRLQFWLDAGSPLWAKGGAATLFGAPLFLHARLGTPWTAEDEQLAETQRLEKILKDLLARVSKKVYLCHSDLAVNGQEQLGPLLPLLNAYVPVK
ncbi:hypothetical protein [Fortiea contorta]|uniref:hypothetical protein n=1 Tax=Fortiea contorta TaxID=1892405 RepID=UPI00034BCDB0|nr:hypothetical protein [Fortiea contorta]